ncbi:hypothetical protein MTO96_015963 [Rhipicephalus appendiculatus]
MSKRCAKLETVIEGCNKALWCVGLQIQQDLRDEVGKVSIAVVGKLRSGFLRHCLETESGLIALAVLRFLWEQHCCVVAVQIFDVLFKEEAVFDGRLRKSRLKRLTIVMDPDEFPFRVIDLAKHIGWMAIDAGVELRFIDGVYRLDAGESLLLALLGVGHLRKAYGSRPDGLGCGGRGGRKNSRCTTPERQRHRLGGGFQHLRIRSRVQIFRALCLVSNGNEGDAQTVVARRVRHD